MADNNLSKKAERIRAAYDKFLAEMGVIKKRRKELIERVVHRIEQEKIKNILDSLK